MTNRFRVALISRFSVWLNSRMMTSCVNAATVPRSKSDAARKMASAFE